MNREKTKKHWQQEPYNLSRNKEQQCAQSAGKKNSNEYRY